MKKFLTSLALIVGCAQAYNPGATASLNTIAIEHHKQFIANFIISKLRTVNIPDIPIPEVYGVTGYVNSNTWNMTSVVSD